MFFIQKVYITLKYTYIHIYFKSKKVYHRTYTCFFQQEFCFIVLQSNHQESGVQQTVTLRLPLPGPFAVTDVKIQIEIHAFRETCFDIESDSEFLLIASLWFVYQRIVFQSCAVGFRGTVCPVTLLEQVYLKMSSPGPQEVQPALLCATGARERPGAGEGGQFCSTVVFHST